MKHFHQGFAPCFLRRELGEQICMFLFEDSGFLKVFTRSRGPPGSLRLVSETVTCCVFFCWVSEAPSLQRGR